MLDNYIKEQPIACQIIKNAILKNTYFSNSNKIAKSKKPYCQT